MKLEDLIEMDQHQVMVDRNIRIRIKGQIEPISEELRKLKHSIDISDIDLVHDMSSEISKAEAILERISQKL